MADRIAHRGPDGSGFYCDDYAALGHRRLSIIDVAGGSQPMTNEDGRLQIIYNGEIFNHAQIRPDLERAGHQYQTRCDTETILHAFEEFGEDCVSHFRGMFAFVIWNADKRELFCARDRLGIKPFYYWTDGGEFVFASEIKALLMHPAVSAEFDEAALPEYLAFGYLSGDNTMFRGIRKLMPGHSMRIRVTPANRLEITNRQYWDVPANLVSEDQDDRTWIAECRQRVEETVRMRLMSDVPLGMFLSGGIDSSTIAALMKRMTDQPVKTFSVGYSEAAYSELDFARELATAIGTDHHEIKIGMTDFFNQLPALIWHEDEPITWPSSVSLYFVSRLAAEQVKVVLTGEGSDELFAGYGRYQHFATSQRWSARYKVLPASLRAAIRNFVGTSDLIPGNLRRKAQHTVVGRGLSFQSLFLDNFYSAFSASEQKEILKNGAVDPESAYSSYLGFWNKREASDDLSRLLYADQKTYLVELLMKQDQMSMACSIESRVPFLDHTFVEFAARVPASLRISGGKGKYILRKAVEDLLPQTILNRKKLGFPTPLKDWLLHPNAASLYTKLLDPNGMLASYLDMPALRSLVERHRNKSIDATDRIWRLLNLQYWGEIFLTGNSQGKDLLIHSGVRLSGEL